MAHDTLLLALDALLADGPHGVTYQHRFVCHEHTECADGCDAHGDVARIEALAIAAHVLMPVVLADPFQSGDHATWPAWYVQRVMVHAGH